MELEPHPGARAGSIEFTLTMPLIYPVLPRSILFAVVFIVFDITEKMLIGVFHGKALAQSFETPGGGGNLGVILVAIIIAISLVPFFAFVELSRLMDTGELSRIFFTRGPRAAEAEVGR